jgi:hypothetical protein
MQQATSSIDNLVSTAGTSLSPKAASAPRFVVNLCASTTPLGLVQPTHAGLKRFTFFVSRRLEEGRERFRLHMGYFESQEEAEKMLDLVRDVYPAAWAGVAPGIKLRARAALPEPAPSEAAIAAPIAATAAPPPRALAVAPLKLELAPDLPRTKPAAELPKVVEATKGAAGSDATSSLSDLRATIASLGDAADAAAPPAPAVLEGEAVLRLLTSARPAPAARIAPVRPVAVRPVAVPPAATSPPAKPVAPPVAAQPEAAVFAVQLLWSVQPIDMTQVAQLAIFSAYTLYGAEGNRDGRRWYGLRLGFFTDAVSAKQVAQYVRSEFNSVSVVPVSERERTRAGAATAKPLPAPAPLKSSGPELNFIDEVLTDTATSGSRPAVTAPAVAKSPPTLNPAAIAAVGMTARATPGKRAKLRTAPGSKPGGKRVGPNRALSLEETLEILGAGDLQIDNASRELLNDSMQHDRKTPTPRGSRFSRLINRLAERLANG